MYTAYVQGPKLTKPGEYPDLNREDPVSLVSVHANIKPSVSSLTQSLLGKQFNKQGKPKENTSTS